MASLCVGCRTLQHTSVGDFGNRSRIYKRINFESVRAVSGDDIGSPGFTDDSYVLQEDAWVSKPGSNFCSRCDLCTLVFDSLSRRYGAAIHEAAQELDGGKGSDLSRTRVQLLLKLSTLIFQSCSGSLGEGRNTREYKGVSVVLLQGTLSITLDTPDAPKEKSVDISLPFEVFADGVQSTTSPSSGVYRRALDSNALSVRNINNIKGWLDNCLKSHSRCTSLREGLESRGLFHTLSGESLFLPTRLVHVGNPSAGEVPRVIHTREEFKSGVIEADQVRYLALSYCWGSTGKTGGNLTSNITNIQERTKAIPWQILPRSFQDVILLAIKLGFRYVWIDSLCILQGQGGDWEEESATMWSVFSSAVITVVAAKGSSPHSGFLTRTLPRSCHVLRPESSGGPFSLRHRPGLKWWGSDRMAEISAGMWITRGWTYQEERLARRVLMFGENKFFFDCRERERCEDSDVWLYRPAWSRIIYDHPADNRRQKAGSGQQGMKKIFNHWQWLCKQYSHCKHTFPEDKLPAFSGVAAAVSSKTQSRYLAGLWEVNLMHDLFWDTKGKIEKSPVYRAPSWSWVSLITEKVYWDGSQTCLGESCQLHCSVLQAETVLAGPNLYGAITGAFLKLEGHMIVIDLVKSTGEYSKDWFQGLAHEGEYIAEAKLDLAEPTSGSALTSKPRTWAILIRTCGNGPDATRGLLLKRVRTLADGLDIFQRVGTFTVFAQTIPELELKLSYWKQTPLRTCVVE